MLKKMLLIISIPLLASAQLIGEHEMPFGASSSNWANDDIYTQECLQLIHDALGFNQIVTGGFNGTTIVKFDSAGIHPYCYSSVWGGEAQTKFAEAQYFICQPESSGFYNIKFKTMNLDNGYPNLDSFFVAYTGNDTMLNDLKFRHPHRYYDLDDHTYIQYYPSLRIKIDTTWWDDSTDCDTLVGIFQAKEVWPTSNVEFLDSIWFSDLRDSSDNIFTEFIELDLYNELDPDTNFFYVSEYPGDTSTTGGWIKYSFVTDSNCTVYIDDFKVHCQFGEQLMNSTSNYDSLIIELISRAEYEDNILGWFLKDTQIPGNYRPFAHIDSLIRNCSGWDDPVYGASWINPYLGSAGSQYHAESLRDFGRIASPKLLWMYNYPLKDETDYTGYDGSSTPHEALQSSLEKAITLPCDSLRNILTINNSIDGWLFTPQAWWCDQTNNCSHTDYHREPTRSEMRCMTFIGMCYHPSSILYWKLISASDSRENKGIIDRDGDNLTLTESMGYAIRDDINPYIKAIDSTYLDLTWDKAYTYKNGEFTPPDSVIISSITAVPNHPDSISPDTGWFHVGEYYDDAGTRYFLLVNRACSKGVNDSSEAGSITAIVELNRSFWGSPTSLLVIDIADSITTEWVAVSETTYTCLYDDELYFTTVLKAGEGRLFKIQTLGNPISITDYDVCQGKYNYDSTVTISSSDTVSFKCPSIITFPQNDSLVINGGLFATGCDTGDSLGLVTFAAETTGVSWKGLLFSGSSAYGELEYCQVENVDTLGNNISISDSAYVDIRNSTIKGAKSGIKISGSGMS